MVRITPCIYINSTSNIISVFLALDKVFTYIMDPTEVHHALSIMAGLPERFAKMRASFENSRRCQLKVIKEQWESMMNMGPQ